MQTATQTGEKIMKPSTRPRELQKIANAVLEENGGTHGCGLRAIVSVLSREYAELS